MKNSFLYKYISKYRLDLGVIILYLVLPFVFFRDTLRLSSIVFGSGDPVFAYIPLQYLASDLIKNLEFPFWNNYVFGGFPLLANVQASIFYPVTFLLNLIFKMPLAYNLSVIFHYSLAGIFLYYFLKEYKLSRIACFAGGMIFMFSGAMISHKSWGPFLYTVVWLPLILFFLEKYRKTKKFHFVLVASIFYAISFFGGLPQIFFYESIIILFFILFNAAFFGRKGAYFLLSLSIFIIVLFLVAVQILPTLELMQNSFARGDNSYTFFTLDSFNPQLFPMLIFPFIFGAKHPSAEGIPHFLHWFGSGDSVEMIIYFGIITIPLLIFSFFVKNKQKYLWIFILIISLIMVLGQFTPVYRLLYYIPVFNKFRAPARHWIEFSFAFSVLCGFGFDYILVNSKEKIRKAVYSTVGILCSVFSGFAIFYLIIQFHYSMEMINDIWYCY